MSETVVEKERKKKEKVEPTKIMKRVQLLMKEYKWSLRKLAIESGVAYPSLYNLIARGTDPSLETLRKICAAFGLTLGEFFTYDYFPQSVYSKREVNLISNFRILSETDKLTSESVIEGLCKKTTG